MKFGNESSIFNSSFNSKEIDDDQKELLQRFENFYLALNKFKNCLISMNLTKNPADHANEFLKLINDLRGFKNSFYPFVKELVDLDYFVSKHKINFDYSNSCLFDKEDISLLKVIINFYQETILSLKANILKETAYIDVNMKF